MSNVLIYIVLAFSSLSLNAFQDKDNDEEVLMEHQVQFCYQRMELEKYILITINKDSYESFVAEDYKRYMDMVANCERSPDCCPPMFFQNLYLDLSHAIRATLYRLSKSSSPGIEFENEMAYLSVMCPYNDEPPVRIGNSLYRFKWSKDLERIIPIQQSKTRLKEDIDSERNLNKWNAQKRKVAHWISSYTSQYQNLAFNVCSKKRTFAKCMCHVEDICTMTPSGNEYFVGVIKSHDTTWTKSNFTSQMDDLVKTPFSKERIGKYLSMLSK